MREQELTLDEICELGVKALGERLGSVGMVRFLQQSENGLGNYTEERHQWLGDPDLRELAQKVQQQHPTTPI